MKNREGSKFRLRLTLFFLVVTMIPIVPLSLISNNLISKSINLWFVGDFEGSLVDALEVSKELYTRFSEESIDEWEELCGDCPEEEMKEIPFEHIDGILSYTPAEKSIKVIYLFDYAIKRALEEMIKAEERSIDSWKRVSIQESEYLLTPVMNGDSQSYLLVRMIPGYIGKYTATISRGLQNYRTLKIIREPIKGIIILFFTVIILPFILLSFYLSLIISREVTGPVKELAIATQRVASDDLEYAIDIDAKDEMKLLIDSFNKMTRDLRVNKELLKQSERSAAWRDIARKIAHEIKNPLTPIKLSAERMLKLYGKDDRYRDILSKGINTIITEVENINDMVNEFSDFARFPDTRFKRINIIGIIKDILGFLRDTYRHIQFSFTHSEDNVYLIIDGTQIRRAILNIIYNSINAISGSGIISIECYPGEEKKGDNKTYIIAITDDGVGIDPEIRYNIFHPYVSKDDKSSGLGLAIVEKIVLDNRGRIWFESKPGKTTFFMEFIQT